MLDVANMPSHLTVTEHDAVKPIAPQWVDKRLRFANGHYPGVGAIRGSFEVDQGWKATSSFT